MQATIWVLTNPPSSWIAELREEETYKRMIASLEKLIDWSSVQVMTLMMPAKEYDWRLEEALRFLGKQCRSWAALPLLRTMAGATGDYSPAWLQ